MHVRRGIAFKRQHVVPVEDIVGGAAFRQVGVFNRTNAYGIGQALHLFRWHVRVFLGDQLACTIDRFIQQIGQFHRAA
ncbi:hypothetical protein D3C71_1727120 [compost metagenome]